MKKPTKVLCINDKNPYSNTYTKSAYVTKGNIYKVVKAYRFHYTVISDYNDAHVTYDKARFRPIYNLTKLKLL